MMVFRRDQMNKGSGYLGGFVSIGGQKWICSGALSSHHHALPSPSCTKYSEQASKREKKRRPSRCIVLGASCTTGITAPFCNEQGPSLKRANPT